MHERGDIADDDLRVTEFDEPAKCGAEPWDVGACDRCADDEHDGELLWGRHVREDPLRGENSSHDDEVKGPRIGAPLRAATRSLRTGARVSTS